MGAPKLFVVSAPSGAGKTTLCRLLLKEFPDQLTLSISSTTRHPRGDEMNGREYFFLAKDQFETAIEEGRFAEWAKVHGNYYGTSKDVINGAFAQGKSVLLDIDVQGASSLAAAYPEACYRIFIAPPDLDTLEQRLRLRGTESEESIIKRLRNAEAEISRQTEFDTILVNDQLDEAYEELRATVIGQLGLAPAPGKPKKKLAAGQKASLRKSSRK